MAKQALAALTRYGDPADLPGAVSFLRAEALRALDRHDDALAALHHAAERLPQRSTEIGLALGWCYKRTGRIELAIAALARVLAREPNNALVLYNLACYWSLAGNGRQSLLFLSRALSLDPTYRDLLDKETDFDNVRSDPDFRALSSVNV